LRDLEAVVDALKLKRFALYGISAGGAAAIAYAARHPERVTRLVLHEASACFDLSLLSPALQEKQKAFWSLVGSGWDNPAFQEMNAAMMMPDGGDVIRRFAAQLAQISGTPEDASAFLAAQGKIDVRPLAPQIRAPTLVIHVRGDQLVPLEFGQQLADLIPGARLVIIQGRDHIPIAGDGEAEQIDPVIQPFLDEDLAKQAGVATRP
jgi:pimeloyl-ACP methyl ester carboxylesterase